MCIYSPVLNNTVLCILYICYICYIYTIYIYNVQVKSLIKECIGGLKVHGWCMPLKYVVVDDRGHKYSRASTSLHIWMIRQYISHICTSYILMYESDGCEMMCDRTWNSSPPANIIRMYLEMEKTKDVWNSTLMLWWCITARVLVILAN